MLKNVFCHHCYLALRSSSKVKIKGSRSKVGIKVTGQGQRSRSNFWCAVVNIRGSALPSAAKSKEESLLIQGVCLCVDRLLIYMCSSISILIGKYVHVQLFH